MITIKDLAKECNVSISTVSKALNNYSDISNELKELILKKSDELGYIPNSNARGLAKKNIKKVAFIVKSSRNQSFIDEISMRYTAKAFDYASDKIQLIVLFDSIFKNKTSKEITVYLQSLGIVGLILFGINDNKDIFYDLLHIYNDKFKKVFIDYKIKNLNTSSVIIDDKQAQYDLINETIDFNKVNNILYLSGPKDDDTAKNRLQAVDLLQKEYNFNLKVIDCQYSDNIAYEKVLKNNKYDAFICANDMMAIGTYKALRKLNINKKILGFDNISLLYYVNNQISTIEQNFENKAVLAIDEIISLLNNKPSKIIYDNYKVIHNN